MPLNGPVLNSAAIVDGTAEARFMPLDGPVFYSEAIVDGTAEARFVPLNGPYSIVQRWPLVLRKRDLCL